MFADVLFLPFATNHRLISFMLYTIGILKYSSGSAQADKSPGFVGFVASLKKQYLKQQFGMFCWVHMSLLVIVVNRYCAFIASSLHCLDPDPPSHFIVNNILEVGQFLTKTAP